MNYCCFRIVEKFSLFLSSVAADTGHVHQRPASAMEGKPADSSANLQDPVYA